MPRTRTQRRGRIAGCTGPRIGNRRTGQSLVESCLAVAVICLVFMGLLQIALLLTGREVMVRAAERGARARTVGFNWWMVYKVVRAAAIPNAGKMLVPGYNNPGIDLRNRMAREKPGEIWASAVAAQPSSGQFEQVERGLIPQYLDSWNDPRARNILHYERWDDVRILDGMSMPPPPGGDDALPDVLHFAVEQHYPLWVPIHRAFFAADSVPLRGDYDIENHYKHYVDDLYR
jgi:hypothetical protein